MKKNKPSALLSVQNLSITINSRGKSFAAVKDVSFTLQPGGTLGVVGESGSGKSLSALAVMGLLPEKVAVITAGKILFEGKNLLTMTSDERRKLRGAQMSMVFQEPMTSLNPVITVGKQVEEVLEIHSKLGAKARKARVLELFKTVQIDRADERYNAYPHELSGGQRQRVMIAMALAMQTKLLIADEPTTALDVTVQKEILRLLKKLQKDFNLSLLFISHDLKVIEEIADEVMVMEKGVAVEYGPVKQVLSKPKHAYTKKLLAAMPGGRSLGGLKPKTGKVLVEARGLSKTYMVRQGGFFSPRKPLQALNDVSFKLIEGETLAVVGESGSGKSTIAKLLVRLIEPTSGRTLFMGRDIAAMDKAALRAARRDIQMVFQDPFSSLNPRMTVGESVGEGIKAHGLMDDKKRRAYVEKLLADCGLPSDAYDRYPHAFSGGQRQRICIARALALKPKLIIADEPVSALDVSVQKQILELLQKFKKDYGLSYLFITHDLRVVQDIADRVLVMHKGKLVEQGPVAQIYTKPQQAYTQRLLAAIPGFAGLRKGAK